ATASGSGWGSGFSDSSAPVAQNDGWGAPAYNGWGAPEPVASTGGWGGSQEQNDGWGAPDTKPAANRIPDLRPDDPQRRTTFAPRLRGNGNDDNVSLTEAASVANFLMNSKNYRTSTNGVLTVCFDIGGSTTDISALYPLVDGVTMIKQNSIRFAAQRVASATRFSPNFGNVLVKACAQFGIKILGLNMGPNQFSPQTAPYYFEQMVDRLPTDKLPEFYALIIANCPELMCVNLYVTGLVMYYAGQLTGKLVDELRRGTDTGMMRAPMVEIVFAGKGSRLFEWFSTTNPQAAENYYSQLFIRGMGGMQQAQKLLCAPPRINLSSQSSDDVKYEVSKGLANTNSKLLVPTQNEAIEILGENDFTITMRDGKIVTLAHDNSITAEMMSYIGQYFNAPLVYENPNANKFMDFASVFYNVASKYFGLKVPQSVFIDGFRNMNIDSYIRNMPEYAAAVRKMRVNPEKKFDFVAPIIVLEGMKFFEDYLLPAIKKQ
ncbi:MAG: hypothetical protein K2M76_07340, partial [Muribaculaceae bacterium]|nr:hypothetical protein [Muribaculaceae bacterium]